MFKKWKKLWLENRIASIENEYRQKIEDENSEYTNKLLRLKEQHRNMLDSSEKSNSALLKRIELNEEELAYRLKTLETRNVELKQADNELKEQIKLLEAKAHPSNVWVEAFTLGINKCWDLLQPVYVENIEKMKKLIYDKATLETLERLNGNHKKTN